MLRCLLLSLWLGLALAANSPAANGQPEKTSALAGSWPIDLSRSTELSPWKGYDLTIAVDGDRATIHRLSEPVDHNPCYLIAPR